MRLPEAGQVNRFKNSVRDLRNGIAFVQAEVRKHSGE